MRLAVLLAFANLALAQRSVTVCQLREKPWRFHCKSHVVEGLAHASFENFTLQDPNCRQHLDICFAKSSAAAHSRTRKLMEIAARSAAAREAQLSRMSQLQEQVAQAYAARSSKKDPLVPGILAGLTPSILSVTFRAWFQNGEQDIRVTTQQVCKTLGKSASLSWV